MTIAHKAGLAASKLDFYLLGAASQTLTPEQRDANLKRGFDLFVRLLPLMRDLKAARPDLYRQAEEDLKQAREIEGRASA